MFTTFASAIDALFAALTADDRFDGVAIRGGEVTAAAVKEAVTIAYESEDTPGVVEGEFTYEGPGISRGRESYSINCAIQVLTGSTINLSAGRVRAVTLLGYVAAALADDPTLGGNVMSSRVGSYGLSQPQTPRGLVTTLVFTVDCWGYTVAIA